MSEKRRSERTESDAQTAKTSEKTQSGGPSLMRRETLALLGIGGLGVFSSGSASAQSGNQPFYNWEEDVDANGCSIVDLGSLSMATNGTAIQDFAGENLSIEDGVLNVTAAPAQSNLVTDQGPWYDYNASTTTEIKETPVPAASLEVVSPDGTETIVAATRDGTDEHGSDAEVVDRGTYITFTQSRDQGQNFSDIATVELGQEIDPSRTGNGLIAVDDTTIYFFDSQVDDRIDESSEATAVHRLSWNSSEENWDITENLNRFKNYRILPHFVEEGVIKVGYVDFTADSDIVRFAEYDPATSELMDRGIINEQPIEPNEHIVKPREDGDLVAIVRIENPDLDTTPSVLQWSQSSDGGESWINQGYIQQTLHPQEHSYGATKGGQMIDTPYGERLVILYRHIAGSWVEGNHRTLLGLFNPYNGVMEQNIQISTVESDEAANGSLRSIGDGPLGWRFYVVHSQGEVGSDDPDSGNFFRDVTLFQPAVDRDDFVTSSEESDDEDPE